ncbi:TniB family NTP-binding protein [Caulobacter soli]|uniref:TniB family NTP-binding protein n=1 Tax=Caulobacter soli TaxID=2708539 RepID=UPI0013EB8BE8|nr:TniB family NTP-binding protein [Caulobacter soli]
MTTSLFGHLHPDIRHLATADRQVRKTCILTDQWISYPAGEDAIERLFELLDMPPRIRMPSILFWAHPNMGKTHIQKRFLMLCAARGAMFVEAVLWLEVNDGLTEKRLYLDLLAALNAPAPDATTSRLQAMVLRQLKARGIRLVILDELQRVTELRPRDQRAILNALKYISNQLSISIAGFGSGEARALIQSDPHLGERFDIIALPKCNKKEKWLVDLVRARLELIPLRKPTQVDRQFMTVLLLHSNSLLGRMFRLLERAAIAALDNEECLSADLIEAVTLRRRLAENG